MARAKYIIGIDEVGRGALAGPVVVAAFAIKKGVRLKVAGLGAIKDSKKLTPPQRGSWAAYLKTRAHSAYAVSRVSPRVIDGMNISTAANLAAWRATMRVLRSLAVPLSSCAVYLDGGLYLKSRKLQESSLLRARTIIKGDEKIPAIAAASIIAKVDRDGQMRRMHAKMPQYGFAAHKGYGTFVHIQAIREFGISVAHRESFTRHLSGG